MTTHLTIHLAVNDSTGRHTGHVTAIEVYGGYELAPLLALHGEPVACGIVQGKAVYERSLVPQLYLTVGEIECAPLGYKAHVGNIIWDSATISLVDAAKVVNALRAAGWTVVEGDRDLCEMYAAGEIDEAALGRAVERERVAK